MIVGDNDCVNSDSVGDLPGGKYWTPRGTGIKRRKLSSRVKSAKNEFMSNENFSRALGGIQKGLILAKTDEQIMGENIRRSIVTPPPCRTHKLCGAFLVVPDPGFAGRG